MFFLSSWKVFFSNFNFSNERTCFHYYYSYLNLMIIIMILIWIFITFVCQCVCLWNDFKFIYNWNKIFCFVLLGWHSENCTINHSLYIMCVYECVNHTQKKISTIYTFVPFRQIFFMMIMEMKWCDKQFKNHWK